MVKSVCTCDHSFCSNLLVTLRLKSFTSQNAASWSLIGACGVTTAKSYRLRSWY